MTGDVVRRFTRIQSETVLMEGGLRVVRHELADAEGNDLDARALVLDLADQVQLVARTSAGAALLLRLHRFGIDDDSVEVPSGDIDPGEPPRQAAARVLLATTGFAPGQLHPGGWCCANPALQNNRVFTFIADGCQRVAEPGAVAHERAVVELVDPVQLRELVARRKVHSALSLVALLEHAL